MRILHVEKFLPPIGGVGSTVRALAERQRAAGHEVAHFGCVASGGRPDMPAWRDFADSRCPLDLARMIHNSEAAAKLERFLRRSPADVAHLHNVYHHLTPSILPVLRRRGVAVVMTLHDYRLVCPTKHLTVRTPDGSRRCMRCRGGRFFHAAGRRCAGLAGAALAAESGVQRLARRYVRGADLFICPTRFMRDLVVEVGAPRGACRVAPNPVEPFETPGAPLVETDRLLYVGALEWGKGADRMLDIAARLPDVEVVLVGDGPMRAELAVRRDRDGLANVRLVGAVPHERLGEQYARATALVLPSRWMENSPQTMLEAMWCGLAVMVADQAPLREWVRDDETGRLFEPEAPDAAARTARELLTDATARRRMAERAKAYVRGRHDADAAAGRVEEIYREARRRCALR